MMRDQIRHHVNLKNLSFILSIVMFIWLIWYFYTGYGGASELVTYLVPIALTLQILRMYREDYLYKWLPPIVNHILVVLYIGICAYAFYHFFIEYEQIAIWRQGSYTKEDFIVGLLAFLLVMELSRIAHPTLFWMNVVLIFYTLWGYLSPIDFFWHPGTSFYRVVTSSTVELSTGIYGLYAQIALTVIAAFLLLAAAARGFDAQGAMVNFMRRIAGKSRHTIPQTAVLASSSVGLVSGSGAANASVVGAFTIPLMKRYGFPGEFAAAVETAASMGGLIMPPVMAVAGFIMAEFLGVPYWDVVLRGFALAFVYYSTLALSVHLLSVRLMPPEPIAAEAVPLYQQLKTGIFFLGIIFLTILMGVFRYGELLAGLYTGTFMFTLLILLFFYFKYVLKDPAAKEESLLANIRTTIETHAEMTSYLTLLLATLGIMIGLFTVTGFINRMGGILLRIGEWHIIALILMAWVFGWIVGAGLPPTATYIILAVIIVDPMRKLGIDPWVANFFAFLLAVWGELSPPTSLAAAVSARIAEASFMKTMWQALKLCLPITFMSFTIFVRSDMVIHPGWPQIADTLLVAIACCGITFSIFGKFVHNWGSNIMLRMALALASLVVMLHPNGNVALAMAVIVLPATVYGVKCHQMIAPPKSVSGLRSQPAT
ncbi:MAG: TRAP transporter fused permease subunit [Pseudomonadota bacterium]|nr:TRAP transporter fused permease subunit [Pseudomonadota bacterium]